MSRTITKTLISIFSVAVLLTATSFAADISEIDVIKNCEQRAGQLSSEPYSLEISVYGTGITSAELQYQGSSLPLEDWGDGEWGIEFSFATEAELNAALAPADTLQISINGGADSATVSNDAAIPAGYAVITSPFNLQTDVPIAPFCTWIAGAPAEAIAVFLYQDPNGTDALVYENWPLPDTTNSVQATELQPSTEHALEVSLANISTGGIREELTANGDTFTYMGVAANTNRITFTTESHIDVQSLLAVRSHEITNNAYRAELSLTGTGITSVMVQGPAGDAFPLEDYGDGEWGAEEAFLTEADVLAAFPDGDYTFTFNGGAATATVSFNGDIPDGTIDVTSPTQDAVNIGKNPTYTWENTSTTAEAQAVFLYEDPQNADEEVYGNMEVDTAATSIQAIDLSPSTEYRFEVVSINFAADPQMVGQIDTGDTFEYQAVAINIAYSQFTTAPMPDVTELFLERTQSLVNGAQAPQDQYSFYVGLENTLNVTQATVTTPYGSTFDIEQDEEDWYLDLSFASEAELAADWPFGTYTFTLNGGFDTITVDYNVAAPADYATITFPQHGQHAVDLNPTFTWNSLEGQCLALGLLVQTDDQAESDVYEDIPIFDTTQTAWTPGPLQANTPYRLVVRAINLQGDEPMPMTTDANDSFDFYGVYMIANTVQFDTNAWPVPGDVNGDCKVNIIDLIAVRNRLNKDTSSGDNWKADVNQDGKVNIIDLIYVRNRLNDRCEP